MINRIRDIRKAKGWTLADLAAACSPATTAQTIGRLETGMRTLSVTWIDRIAAALEVDADALVRSESRVQPAVVARLGASGAEALSTPREAVLPTDLAETQASGAAMIVLEVEAPCGPYLAGDQLYLRQLSPDEAAQAINRDVLVPRAGGRFAFGRLIDRKGSLVGLLPPGMGEKQLVVDSPAWIAVAQMLVRPL